MRIGIDCRTYGSSHGYRGKYIESFVSFLDENEDTNEYILFFSTNEWREFSPKSSQIRVVETSAGIGSIAEQIVFPHELRKEKLDGMFFTSPYIPAFYFGKSISLISDLSSYFYPQKHRGGALERYWQTFLLRESMRKSSALIVLSEVLKRDIIEIFDTHEEKIHVIPPLYREVKPSKNNLASFLTQEGIGEKYLLSVGELREYKNIPRLLQAYHLLTQEDSTAPDLVLIGKEDPTYHEIRSTLISLGLQNRVHIYNVIDEEKLEFLYQNATLFILPSLYEGSEEVLLAPLAHHLPIAASILPSITSALSKDQAVFFRPMSVREIQEVIKTALSPLAPKQKKDMNPYSPASVNAEIHSAFDIFKGNPPV